MRKSLLSYSLLLATLGQAYADDMEHILVSAARDGINASESGASVTVIDEQQLALRPNIALADLLRSVPGLAVNQTSGLGSQVQLRMRGGEANHVLVFIDGVQANDPAQGDDFNFAHLLNIDIASIEVVRGPQSALWGSDALSGMVYIRSKDGREGASLNGFIEGGSNDWQNIGLSGSIGDQDANLRITLNSSDTEGSNVSNFGDELDGYSNDSAKISAFYRLNPQVSIGANSLYIDSDTDFDSLDYDMDYSSYMPINAETYGLPIDADNHSSSKQNYSRAYADFVSANGGVKLHADVSYAKGENHNMTESMWSMTGYDETISESERLQYTLQGTFSIAANTDLTAAIEREEQDYQLQSAWLNGNESMDSTAYALQLKGKLSDNLNYLLSTRRDNNTDFGDANTYRASFSWQAKDMLRVRGAIGTGSKNPTFTELFGYSSSFKGNPALIPEESESWELGIDLTVVSTAQASLTYFEDTLQNEIRTVYDYTDRSSTSINVDEESDRSGVELSIDFTINNQLQTGFSYTKLSASEASVVEIRRPERMASAYLNWASNDGKRLVSINLDHNGEMTDTFFGVMSETVVLGSYNLLSVHASQQLSDHLNIYGRIENGLNENYEEIYGFNTPQSTYTVGLKVNF